MSKKVQKTLTGALAAVMATGVVATPALAASNTDVDALYKAAYEATQKALTEKTQASVNEARTAIKALPANMDWAIGEFSKLVDTVQHPILVNIVNAIKNAEAEPNQANVNAAKKAIPAELTATWKNSYSSAVDKIQQGLQVAALEAIKMAEADKTQENVDAAKALVDDLLTADSEAIKTWAETLSDRVEAIKIYQIDVTKVTSMDRYTVEVEFTALTENLKNVTIEVIDNNGNVQEIAARNLLKGAKKATFEFKNVLGATALKGVWTVDGIEYDFTEAKLVSAVVDKLSAATDEEVKALGNAIVELQEEGYISGLLGEYNSKNEFVYDSVDKTTSVLSLYQEKLKAKKADIKNAEDVQAIIDKVNSDLEGNISVANLIKIANSTATDKQVYNAMVELGLEKVNADWAELYRTELKGKSEDAKIETIQEAVYTVNKGEIDKKTYTITDTNDKTLIKNAKTTIEEKIVLVEDYYKDDADKVTAKADLLKTLKIDIALLDVKAVTDETDLGAALMNLSDVVNDKDKFSYSSDINEAIMAKYLASLTKATSVADLKTKAAEVQKSVLTDKVAAINTEAGKPDNADELLKALKVEEIGLKNVLDANKDEYFADATTFATVTADNVQATVNAVNARVELNKATTVEATLTALNSYVSIKDKALFDKSEAIRKDYAEEILADKNKNKTELKVLDNVDTAISNAGTAIDKKLEAVNILKVESGAVTYIDTKDRADLVAALKDVTGKTESEVDTLISKFIEKSTVKDATGTVTGVVKYTTYTQVRDVLK